MKPLHLEKLISKWLTSTQFKSALVSQSIIGRRSFATWSKYRISQFRCRWLLLWVKSMTSEASRLPSRKWSIVALGSAGIATVIFSYIFAIFVALACLSLPVVLFKAMHGLHAGLGTALLLSAFGLAAGLTILGSLVPQQSQFDVSGILIDLSKEGRLAKEIEAIASALREPMPSDVYLVAEANAFVTEKGGFLGVGRRRIMGLGLPLLQMLTIAQFRAVLAHEFAHYYAGDTRLGPWVYNARNALVRVFQNLGKKSEILSYLRRWMIVAGPYMLLMGAMRMYWSVFMRITQSISRRQEFRSDELACYIAGSRGLIEGLESIRSCQAFLNPYWNSVVLPAAMSGFKPELADGFWRYMQAPRIAKAAKEFLSTHNLVRKASPFDSHPPLNERIERAQFYNRPEPVSFGQTSESGLPMISLIAELGALETSLLRKLVPAVTKAELKPLNWETAAAEVYIPTWRKQVAAFLPLLSTMKLGDLPVLVLEPRPISNMVPNPPGMKLGRAQRDAMAVDVLFCAFALCLLDRGWKLIVEPGTMYLEYGSNKVEPSGVISGIKSGELSVLAWRSYRAQREMGDWPLASPVPTQPQAG